MSPAITSSFTPFAFAPGVLKTTIPFFAQESSGILFTPAPARPIARRESGSVISCIEALRRSTASAFSIESAMQYVSSKRLIPALEIGFKQ